MKRLAVVPLLFAIALAGCGGNGKPRTAPTTTPPATSTSPTATPTRAGTQIVWAAVGACPSSVCSVSPFGPARADDLWLYDAATGAERRLTNDGSDRVETVPQFTGTGSASFVEAGDEKKPGGALFEVDLKGGQPRELFRLAKSAKIIRYHWHPDGGSVAFLEFREEGTSALKIWTRSTAAMRTVKSFPALLGRGVGDTDDVAVSWSPDGSMLLVVDTFRDGVSDATLWVLRLDGANVVTPQDGTFGRWAADGKAVYYRGWSKSQSWYRLTVPGGKKTTLDVAAGRLHPSVSPDGRYLAFHDGKAEPSSFVFDLEEGKERRVGPGVVPLWISASAIVVTDAKPCEGGDACAEAPAWVATGSVSGLALTGTGTAGLFGGWTLNADVLLP